MKTIKWLVGLVVTVALFTGCAGGESSEQPKNNEETIINETVLYENIIYETFETNTTYWN